MFYGIQHPVRRKLLALLLSVLMICSTAAPAFADLFAFETVFPPEQEPVFKDGEVKAWSGDYCATVTYGADAELSEGTQLVMQEIPKGTTQYDEYLAAATATVGEDEKAVFVRFFDIELQDKDGNPVEPEARVAVNISSAELSNADKITVVHFPAITGTEENGVEDIVRGMIDAPLGDTKGALSLRGGKKLAADIPMEGVARKSADGINAIEAVETPATNETQSEQLTPAIEVIDAETSSGVISFFADGFSVYGIIYTVSNDLDGKTYTSASMPGAESMPLAEVIRGLGIVSAEEVDAFVSRISTVVSANEDVAVVETIEGVLNVRVLKEGDAQIVITMQDGATFRVDVMAEGETTAGDETATVSTVGDLYLPAEAKVEVKVLNEEQRGDAIAAVQAVEETADSASEAKTAYQVFDISLENVEADRYDGFQVEVNLPESVVGKDFHLYHIHDGETTEIELNTVSKPADETGLEVVSGFTFETKDFSEFVLKYTVDVNYEGRSWSFPGQGSFLVSDILAVLEIEGSVDDASLTLIRGEDHEGALYLTQVDGEYYINSDIAFKDTYELRVQSGEKVYIITVTDTQATTELKNLLRNAVIVGAIQDSEGKYHVEAGQEYEIILTFGEDASYQFDNEATLTYQMPDGITILTEQTGRSVINVVYNGRTYSIPYDYVLDTNGLLEIVFDQSDPDFQIIKGSTDVSFRFTYEGKFNGNKTNIVFNDAIERDIVFDEPEPGQAYAEKTATYDETTGTFHYTITVTATGDVTNVNVNDVLIGNALVFNNDVLVSVDSNRYTDNHATNGFDYTFASMAKDETITITYSANVDFDADTDGDGKITADQTKNTVTVQPDDGDPHNSEYSHEINFKTTSKSAGTDGGTAENGDKILNWTIDYNPLALVSAAGDTIIDRIGVSSQDKMKYYGSGITVEVRDRSGALVDTRYINYSDLTHCDDTTWTYTIPETDTTPYHYTIKYHTVVDMTLVNGVPVAVDNYANDQHNSAIVVPTEMINVTKIAESFDTTEVNWVATLSVPANGLPQAVVYDDVPVLWYNSHNYYDFFEDGSLQIDGLVQGDYGEDYVVTLNKDGIEGRVYIEFYKDKQHQLTGLQGTGNRREITIRLTTKVNQDWLQIGYEGGSGNVVDPKVHTNTIYFNLVPATAQVIYDKPGIKKTGTDPDNKQITYTITLSGVSEEPVSIHDTYDRNLLEMVTTNFVITGGDQWYQGNFPTPISYTDTPDGFVLTANTLPKNPENGLYYDYYRIVYIMKLKDGVDLEQLAIANGGEYDLTYKAIWNGHESEFTYKTTYDFLNKELLNKDALGDTSREAQYRITFNAAKATLNGGEPMVMTDVMSANLSVDYSSIQIVTDPAGQPVPYSLSGGKDEHGISDGTTVATYTVPDSTKVTITYTANVRGNGSQTIVNKVSIHGEEETIETTKSYGGGSEGQGTSASFKIVKVDGYDANKKLQGVQFKIFAENPDLDFGGKVQHAKEIILTTDPNGEIILDGENYDFYYNQRYHVQEVEPLDGYSPISFDYLVTLTNDMARVDYGYYIYYFSDSMQIKNWPLEGLVVEKKVDSGVEADHDAFYTFKVSILNDDGTVNTDYNETNGDDTFENGVVEFHLKDKETKMFWGFEKGTKYKVEEIDSKGLTVSVTYKVYDAEGNVINTITESGETHSGTLTQESEVITFTNKKRGSLKIVKNVTVGGNPTNGTQADGTYTFVIKDAQGNFASGKVNGVEIQNGEVSVTITNGQSQSVIVTDLAIQTYTITEEDPTTPGVTFYSAHGGSEVNGKVVTITPAHLYEGQTHGDAQTATFNNDFSDRPDELFISVRKKFVGLSASEVDKIKDSFSMTIIGSPSRKQYVLDHNPSNSDVSLSHSEDGLIWLWKIHNVSADDTYTITETGETITGYEVTTEGIVDADGQSISHSVTPANIVFDESSIQIATHNSQRVWPVAVGMLFAASLDNSGGNKGTLIVTDKSLSASERKAVEDRLLPMLRKADSNVWKTPVLYYSIEQNPGSFSVNGGTATYDKTAGTVTFSDTDIWQHRTKVAYTINDPIPADFTVTNTYIPLTVSLNIVKVSEDNAATRLPEASFVIQKIKDKLVDQKIQYDGELLGTETTDSNGEASFGNVGQGYFEIRETQSPKGYILTGENRFYIKVEGTTVYFLEMNLSKENLDEWEKTTANGYKIGNVTYTPANNAATFTVENTPGAALPSTGSDKTLLYTSLGLTMLLALGAVLNIRRRKQEQE